jgi:pentalenolactone synthase
MTSDVLQLPFPRDGILDLAPAFRALSAQGPVHRVRTQAGGLAWLVTGYDEARALFSDHRLGRSHPDPDNAARISESGIISGPVGDIETEQAQHQQMRKLLAPAFSARRMQALNEHVATLVDGLLDDLAAATPPVDLHEALSFPLPVLVICELLGVPYADRHDFRVWSAAAGTLNDAELARWGMTHLHDYVRGLVATKRAEPAADVISDLGRPELGLPDDVIAGLCATLLFAGHETTVTRIDTGTLLLLTNPDQREVLRARPELLDQAVEEILRLAIGGGGLGGLPRYAHADITVGNITIATGDLVLLTIGAANRDPAVFDEPDAFSVERASNPHLAFGHGGHYCLGASLARVELRAVFHALVERFPGLRLAVPIEDLRPVTGQLIGGIDHLPVTW